MAATKTKDQEIETLKARVLTLEQTNEAQRQRINASQKEASDTAATEIQALKEQLQAIATVNKRLVGFANTVQSALGMVSD